MSQSLADQSVEGGEGESAGVAARVALLGTLGPSVDDLIVLINSR
jgi:hypothetical protein